MEKRHSNSSAESNFPLHAVLKLPVVRFQCAPLSFLNCRRYSRALVSGGIRMPFNGGSATLGTTSFLVDSSRLRRIKLGLLVGISLSVWGYARFGTPVSLPPTQQSTEPLTSTNAIQLGPFAQPMKFIAVPGGQFKRIHARLRPSVGSAVRAYIPRGTHLTGIARERGAHGETWIKLDNGLYVKETVVVPQPTMVDH